MLKPRRKTLSTTAGFMATASVYASPPGGLITKLEPAARSVVSGEETAKIPIRCTLLSVESSSAHTSGVMPACISMHAQYATRPSGAESMAVVVINRSTPDARGRNVARRSASSMRPAPRCGGVCRRRRACLPVRTLAPGRGCASWQEQQVSSHKFLHDGLDLLISVVYGMYQ